MAQNLSLRNRINNIRLQEKSPPKKLHYGVERKNNHSIRSTRN